MVAAGDIEMDEGVMVLTEQNFDDAIANNENMLVEFYAPWCSHCKSLAPEYVKAAKMLLDTDVKASLAKIDATEESKLAERFEVRGYPTIKFFKNGKPLEYNGGRTGETIVSWLEKKTGPPAKALDTADDSKAFVEAQEVAVIGFFKDQTSDLAKVFLDAAGTNDDVKFGITSDDKVFKEHDVSGEDKIVLFKKFDEGRVDYDGKADAEDIGKFVGKNSLPLVIEFTQETAQKIFSGEVKNHLLIFVEKTKEEEFKKISDAARQVAKSNKGEMLFVTIDTSDEEHKRIMEFFGMKEEEVPAMRIIVLKEDMSKFKPETLGVEKKDIETFVKAFLDGKIKRHLMTDEISEDWDKAPVKILVGKNFQEVAMNKDKDVLVEFYAPWC